MEVRREIGSLSQRHPAFTNAMVVEGDGELAE
jgi:hypothetical protein